MIQSLCELEDYLATLHMDEETVARGGTILEVRRQGLGNQLFHLVFEQVTKLLLALVFSSVKWR